MSRPNTMYQDRERDDVLPLGDHHPQIELTELLPGSQLIRADLARFLDSANIALGQFEDAYVKGLPGYPEFEAASFRLSEATRTIGGLAQGLQRIVTDQRPRPPRRPQHTE